MNVEDALALIEEEDKPKEKEGKREDWRGTKERIGGDVKRKGRLLKFR